MVPALGITGGISRGVRNLGTPLGLSTSRGAVAMVVVVASVVAVVALVGGIVVDDPVVAVVALDETVVVVCPSAAQPAA